MADFLQMHIYLRAVILSTLLFVTIFDTFFFISMLSKRNQLMKAVVLLVFSAFSVPSLVYFSTLQNAVVNNIQFSHGGYAGLIWVAIGVSAANIGYLLWMALYFRKEQKNKISPLSVKESFDNLPTGLCFAKENGMVQLVNYQMNRLSYLLTGSDLQNAEAFWKLVSEGELDDDVERVFFGEGKTEIRFKDDHVWSFAREVVDSVIQITANDVTEYHSLTDTLEEKNADLIKMNERLRKHGENVDEVTRSKERLETKMRIHSEFGRALIVTRHALDSDDSDLTSVPELWKRNIAVLRMEAEPVSDADHLSTLVKAAESAGVVIEVRGRMPRDKEARMLILAAAAETLTNAVRHAQAQKLLIEIETMPDCIIARFTNDGRIPESDVVVEGGGLSSLRKKVERAKGEMEIVLAPRFVLSVKLPKEMNRYI